jgi:hypothetical protein
MYVQGRQAIANIASALERAGASFGNVVRRRMFVTDIEWFAEVARAHRESFGVAPRAVTAVEVRGLVHPDMLVETEVDVFAPIAGQAAASITPKPRKRRVVPTPPRVAGSSAKAKPTRR